MKSRILLSFILPLLLQACAVPEEQQAVEVGQGESAPGIAMLPETQTGIDQGEGDQARLIADLLYEALQALDADRLLTPIDDNAHARFRRVLAYEPDNSIALQGLQDIVERYVELGEEATRRGLFDDAELMLDRARFVDDSHPDIAEAALALEAEKNSGDLFFNLDNREFASRSEAAQKQLVDIARQAREHAAFFLITAPNDDLARWMFGIMRDSVTGYRLRGNIELASQTSIRLRIPVD